MRHTADFTKQLPYSNQNKGDARKVKKKKKKKKNLHKKNTKKNPPADTLQPRALEKISRKTNMERMQLKTMEVFMSPEALKTKLLTCIVNSLKQSRASFQIKKSKTKKCYEFASRSHSVHLTKNKTMLEEKYCSVNEC